MRRSAEDLPSCGKHPGAQEAPATSCYTLFVNLPRSPGSAIATLTFIACVHSIACVFSACERSAGSAKEWRNFSRSTTATRKLFGRVSRALQCGPRDAPHRVRHVYFRRPGRMRWEYEAPEKSFSSRTERPFGFMFPADHTVTKAPLRKARTGAPR